MMVKAPEWWPSDSGDAIIYRANRDALRLVEVTFAVIAFLVVDDVDTALDADGDIRALWQTGIAAGTGGGVDLVGHGDTPLSHG
jgi:hypothetical protein